MSADRYQSFAEFWPYYVSQHLRPATRTLHFVGTTLVFGAVLAGVFVSPLWLLSTPLFGYGLAWIGHYGFERNHPATFTHPLWSLRADFRLYRLMLFRRMGPEVARAVSLYGARPAASR